MRSGFSVAEANLCVQSNWSIFCCGCGQSFRWIMRLLCHTQQLSVRPTDRRWWCGRTGLAMSMIVVAEDRADDNGLLVQLRWPVSRSRFYMFYPEWTGFSVAKLTDLCVVTPNFRMIERFSSDICSMDGKFSGMIFEQMEFSILDDEKVDGRSRKGHRRSENTWLSD